MWPSSFTFEKSFMMSVPGRPWWQAPAPEHGRIWTGGCWCVPATCTPGVNVKKLFIPLLMLRQNRPRLVRVFKVVLYLQIESKTARRGAAFNAQSLQTSSMTRKYYTCVKNLPGTNTLAYSNAGSVIATKSFIRLTPVVNVIKLFFFVTDNEA